jgi:hypothetical protein
VRAESKTADSRELLRERYCATRVRLLFVGEAPPASGLFFYRADSGLYRAIRSAFITAFPALRNADFLESFQALGCYLVDLCGRPVDRLAKQDRKRVCAESEVRLARTIRRLQPQTVVSVVVPSQPISSAPCGAQIGWDCTSVFPIPDGGTITKLPLERQSCPSSVGNSVQVGRTEGPCPPSRDGTLLSTRSSGVIARMGYQL